MNTNYLIHYLSEHLHTLIRKYSRDSGILEEFCGLPDFKDRSVCSPEIAQQLVSFNTAGIPALASLNEEVAYASVETPDFFFLIGPVKFPSPIRLKFNADTDPMTKKWLSLVPECPFSLFLRDVLLCANLFRDVPYTEQELLAYNCLPAYAGKEECRPFSEDAAKHREQEGSHSPYDWEMRILDAIETGGEQQLKECWEKKGLWGSPSFSQNHVRNAKDWGIAAITLASRAAIRGGVVSEIAYSFSESCIQGLEELTDTESILNFIYSCELHYTQMVKELQDYKEGKVKTRRNPLIHQCKEYIFAHLRDKICIHDIAQELGMNANYLSECFKQYEGISMKSFILKEKIKLAKNLLIYSRYSYLEISSYLGFSSQSHLGKDFKKETGFTLRQYREMYGAKSFSR